MPMLVTFDYQVNGVRVNGVWYPIVKMEWVNGLRLDQQVEEWVTNRDTGKLSALANQWFNVVTGLQQSQMAHGDLQHENILVSNGYIRLVDYDGVFVPNLAGRGALELGHIHYQHPRRTKSDFHSGLDNFSALVIYLSLKALSVDPGLWARFHKDKHLILRADDFKSPQTSQVIVTLKQSKDAEVRKLASALETACASPLSSVPTLSSILATSSSTLADWRKSWAGMEPVTFPKTPPPPPSVVGPSRVVAPPKPSIGERIRNWFTYTSTWKITPASFWRTMFAIGILGGGLGWLSSTGIIPLYPIYLAAAPAAYLTTRRPSAAFFSQGLLMSIPPIIGNYFNSNYFFLALVSAAGLYAVFKIAERRTPFEAPSARAILVGIVCAQTAMSVLANLVWGWQFSFGTVLNFLLGAILAAPLPIILSEALHKYKHGIGSFWSSVRTWFAYSSSWTISPTGFWRTVLPICIFGGGIGLSLATGALAPLWASPFGTLLLFTVYWTAAPAAFIFTRRPRAAFLTQVLLTTIPPIINGYWDGNQFLFSIGYWDGNQFLFSMISASAFGIVFSRIRYGTPSLRIILAATISAEIATDIFAAIAWGWRPALQELIPYFLGAIFAAPFSIIIGKVFKKW